MSSDPRGTLERIARRVPVPEPAYDRLLRRKRRKDRNRRLTAGVLAIVVMLLGITALTRVFGGSSQPAGTPTTPYQTPSAHGLFFRLGGWIAFGDSHGIEAVDPEDASGVHVHLSDLKGEPVDWSQDGSELLVLQQGTLHHRRSALYVLHADGSATLLVRGDARHDVGGGSFSPDGSKVVFAYRSHDAHRSDQIDVIVATGGARRRLYQGAPAPPSGAEVFQGLGAPRFSPDGSEIAFVEGMGDHDNTLRVMNADGTGLRTVLPDAGVLRVAVYIDSLSWSPDGGRLAFGTGYTPNAVFTVGTDGSGLRRLLTNASYPEWSPDGTRIAFDDGGNVVGPLAVANADGTHRSTDVLGARSGPWNPLPRAAPAQPPRTTSAEGATGT